MASPAAMLALKNMTQMTVFGRAVQRMRTKAYPQLLKKKTPSAKYKNMQANVGYDSMLREPVRKQVFQNGRMQGRMGAFLCSKWQT